MKAFLVHKKKEQEKLISWLTLMVKKDAPCPSARIWIKKYLGGLSCIEHIFGFVGLE